MVKINYKVSKCVSYLSEVKAYFWHEDTYIQISRLGQIQSPPFLGECLTHMVTMQPAGTSPKNGRCFSAEQKEAGRTGRGAG